jgi:hypothetical protein
MHSIGYGIGHFFKCFEESGADWIAAPSGRIALDATRKAVA